VKEDIERQLADLPLKNARESSRRARLAKFRRRHPRLSTALVAGVLLFVPAGAVTGLQGYSSYRLRQRERAEALVLRDGSLRDAFSVQTLVHSRSSDSRLFQISRERGEELVERYRVEAAADWDSRSEVSRLGDPERRELFEGMGDAFFALARATEEHARDTHDPTLREQAQRWGRLADGVLGKLGRAPSESWKRPRPLTGPERSGTLPELGKLDEDDLYRLAGELMAESRFRQAVTVFDELLIRKPQHFMAWFQKAGCLDNLGNSPSALQAWETCVALQPEFAACHQNLGLSAYRCKSFTRAERAFAEAHRLEPKLVNALVNRALCRTQLGRHADAERDLTDALAADAPATVAYFLRADVRRKLGRAAEADADFAAGMKHEPTDEWGFSMRGYFRAFQAKPDVTAAIEDLDRALAINPRNVIALNNKIFALERLGRLPAATATSETYLSYYPDMLPMHATRGVYLARQGDAAGAMQEAEFCLKSAPPSAFMYYQVGSLYATLSRHDVKFKARALDLLEASVARGMDRPELFGADADLDALRAEERFAQLASLAGKQAELKRKRVALP